MDGWMDSTVYLFILVMGVLLYAGANNIKKSQVEERVVGEISQLTWME